LPVRIGAMVEWVRGKKGGGGESVPFKKEAGEKPFSGKGREGGRPIKPDPREKNRRTKGKGTLGRGRKGKKATGKKGRQKRAKLQVPTGSPRGKKRRYGKNAGNEECLCAPPVLSVNAPTGQEGETNMARGKKLRTTYKGSSGVCEKKSRDG